MTEPLQPATPDEHASHDLASIAALAARDPGLEPAQLAQARAMLAACDACTELLADLVAVTSAVPAAAVPDRPRSFTLTAADAARLRPAGWRRFLRTIGSARDGVSFPLAMGLTTLGIAGLLVATIPALSGGTGGAATLSTVGAALPAQGEESLSIDAATDQAGDEESGVFYGGDEGGAAAASPGERTSASVPAEGASIRDDATGMSVLIVLAGVMLIVGLGLFALRWTARRLGDG